MDEESLSKSNRGFCYKLNQCFPSQATVSQFFRTDYSFSSLSSVPASSSYLTLELILLSRYHFSNCQWLLTCYLAMCFILSTPKPTPSPLVCGYYLPNSNSIFNAFVWRRIWIPSSALAFISIIHCHSGYFFNFQLSLRYFLHNSFHRIK